MTEFETRLRSGMEHYGRAVQVAPPPLDELLDRPDHPRGHEPGRPRYLLAAAGITAAAAVVGGAVAWLTRDDAATVTSVDACTAGTAAEGVVGSGALNDGRPWEVTVTGQPPNVSISATTGGESLGGLRSDQTSWASLVNQGKLYMSVDFLGGGLLVYGVVPASATTVELRSADGEVVLFCPVSVRGVDVVRYFAGYVPTQPPIEGIVAADAAGRRVAYLSNPQRLYDSLPNERGVDRSVGIDLTVDTEQVGLPLGSEEWATLVDGDLHDVLTGELPSGSWSARAGGDGTLVGLDLVLPGDDAFPMWSGSPDYLLAEQSWQIEWVDNRYFVAGLVDGDVAMVTATLADGQKIEIPTADPGVPGLDGRVFATPLPEGAELTALHGLTSDGTAIVKVDDLTAPLSDLQSFGDGFALRPKPVQ